MARQSISKFGLLAGMFFSLIGCASDSGGGGGGVKACVPNSTQACLGPNNCAGVQTCTPAGSGYAACTCSSGTGGFGAVGSGGSGGLPSGGTGGSGGSGALPSGGTGGGPTCAMTFADSACNSCFQSKCQSQCVDCSSNPDCIGLNNCIANCTTSSCISSCVSAFPNGSTAFESVLSCATNETLCGPVCDTNGPIASDCNHDYECASGTCSGTDPSNGFCTMSCTNSNACGDYAWCMPNSSGYNLCFPACTYTSDCSYLGPEFTCQSWTSYDGYYVSACAT